MILLQVWQILPNPTRLADWIWWVKNATKAWTCVWRYQPRPRAKNGNFILFPFILLILWYTQRNARVGQTLPYIELNLTTYVSCWELSYIDWSEKGNNLVSRVTGYTIVYSFLELNVVHLFILQCVILKFISAGGFTFTAAPLSLPANGPVTRVDALTVAWWQFPVLFSSLLLHGLAACRWRYLNVVLHVLVGWPIMLSTCAYDLCAVKCNTAVVPGHNKSSLLDLRSTAAWMQTTTSSLCTIVKMCVGVS